MSLCAIIPVANLLAANAALAGDEEAESDNKYYVYAHLDDEGVPFYIGKGHGRRHLTTRRRNKHHTNCLKKYGLRAVILVPGLPNKTAMRVERDIIRALRNQGVALANYTDGGEGSSGYRHTPEVIEKLRIISTGFVKSMETREKHRQARIGYKHKEETKAAISVAHVGKTFSEESRRKMSDAQKKHAASPGYVNPRKGVELSDETKAKLRAALVGRKLPEETKRKLSEVGRGRRQSAEHVAKRMASRKATMDARAGAAQ